MSLHETGFFSHWLVVLVASFLVLSPFLFTILEMDFRERIFTSGDLAIVVGAPVLLWLLSLLFTPPGSILSRILFYIFYFFAAANPIYSFFSWFAHEFVNPRYNSLPFFKYKDYERVFNLLLVLLNMIYFAIFFGITSLSTRSVTMPWAISLLGVVLFLGPVQIMKRVSPMIKYAVSDQPAMDLVPFWSFLRFIAVWSRPAKNYGSIVKDGVGRVELITYYDMYENQATLIFTYLTFMSSFIRWIGLYFLISPWFIALGS